MQLGFCGFSRFFPFLSSSSDSCYRMLFILFCLIKRDNVSHKPFSLHQEIQIKKLRTFKRMQLYLAECRKIHSPQCRVTFTNSRKNPLHAACLFFHLPCLWGEEETAFPLVFVVLHLNNVGRN